MNLLIRTPPHRREMLTHCGKASSLIVVGDVVYRNTHDILEVEVPIPMNGNGVVNAVAFE